MPMDETLAVAALDLSGRPYLAMKAPIRARRVGDLQAELLEDFFHGWATSAGANVHLKVAYGRSSHHAVEALFKAFARALALRLLARLAPEAPTSQYEGPAMIALARLRRRQRRLRAQGGRVLGLLGGRRRLSRQRLPARRSSSFPGKATSGT